MNEPKKKNDRVEKSERSEGSDRGEKEFKPKKRFDSKPKFGSDNPGLAKSDSKFRKPKDKKDKDFSSPRSEGKGFKQERPYKKK